MDSGTRARAWFGLTAFVVFSGLVIQLFVAADADPVYFDTAAGRVVNVLFYFTIQSNIVVGVTCLLLALELGRRSTAFSTFRLIGLVGIIITGVVYHGVIADTVDFENWALVADNLTHTIVPIMAVVGWLMFGPRHLTSRPVMWLSLLFPVLYMVVTVIRGAIVDFYPYHFADVIDLGYLRVAVNGVWITVLYLGVAAVAGSLDDWLARVGARSD
ncbi:MAG TPA: Pr6Pr family membrane protein [Acidimicrobiia bacterium]|jgi:hypothetical protein